MSLRTIIQNIRPSKIAQKVRTFNERKRYRLRSRPALCEHLGSKLLLFRFNAERYQKRLLIVSHGCLKTSTNPQVFAVNNVDFRFLTKFKEPAALDKAKKQIREMKFATAAKDQEHGLIRNYSLSKTLGLHAYDSNDRFYSDYASEQDEQATIHQIEGAAMEQAIEALNTPDGLPEEVLALQKEILDQGYTTPYDLLSVRNRFWDNEVTLKHVYDSIKDFGYSEIICVFCRVVYNDANVIQTPPPPGFNF